MSFFKVWRNLNKKTTQCIFMGEGLNYLKIHLTMAGKVGNIKNILLNNFKIVKSTKIHNNL